MKTLSRDTLNDLLQMQNRGDLALADSATLEALKDKYDTIADTSFGFPDYNLMRRDAMEKSNRIHDILQARKSKVFG